jgi:hypothetical protein
MKSSAQTILHENLPVIEVNDKLLLDALLADRRTAHYILVRLSEHTAVIDPEQFDALLALLRKQGHTPQVKRN